MTSSDSVKAPGTIEGWLQADLVPLRARDLDVIAQEAARLGPDLGQICHSAAETRSSAAVCSAIPPM